MFDVVSIGNATMDAFVQINPKKHYRKRGHVGELFFAAGSKTEVEGLHFFSGGSATNTAVGFSRQGLKTACLCQVGQDASGEKILEELTREGVDSSLVLQMNSMNTAYSVILTGHGLNRVILAFGGATRKLDDRQSKIKWNLLKQSRCLYLGSLHSSLDLVERIGAFSKKNGIMLAWNPGQSELKHGFNRLKSMLKHVSILFLNGEEAEQLAGKGSYQENAKTLSEFVPLIIITLGPKGACGFDGKQLFFERAHAAKKVDTAGAGDAFNSGFLSSYLRNESLPACLKNGVNNATSVIQHLGAKNNLLYLK